jgi:hypothetical protein
MDFGKLVEKALDKGWTVSAAVAIGSGLILYLPAAWRAQLRCVDDGRDAFGVWFAAGLFIGAAHVLVVAVQYAFKSNWPKFQRRLAARRELAALTGLGPAERVILNLAMHNDGVIWMKMNGAPVVSLLKSGVLENTGTTDNEHRFQLRIKHEAQVCLRRDPQLYAATDAEIRNTAV